MTSVFACKRGELFGFLGVNGLENHNNSHDVLLFSPTGGDLEDWQVGVHDEEIRQKLVSFGRRMC